MNRSDRVHVGVIGCGHWGPNHIRVFSELERSEVVACADLNHRRLSQVQSRFPRVITYPDPSELLADPGIDAVVIATPTETHAGLVREALRARKHVLVEKPLCVSTAEAADLPALAESVDRLVMVGHVFLYNNGIVRLKEAIDSGDLGDVLYLDAVRTNLGPIRGDVNALFDLGTHDVSIFNYLMGKSPIEVAALGRSIFQRGIEDVCFATLRYPDGILGHIHVSWINPNKVRSITVVGERRMAHWDDVNPSETLRLFDKGVAELPRYNSFGEFQCLLRSGDVHLPRVDRVEPLVNQANAFLDSLLKAAPCRSGMKNAIEIVSVLEAAAQSMQNGGALQPVRPPTPSLLRTVAKGKSLTALAAEPVCIS